MGEHSTWFHLFPGYQQLEEFAGHYLERTWRTTGLEETYFTLGHVLVTATVVILLAIGAFRYASKLRRAGDDRVIPEGRFGTRTIFDVITGAVLALAEGVMGRDNARRFLPLTGTFIFFILFNNLMGLVPGFLSPTDTLKTNIALSGMVFVLTHIYGMQAHGPAYLKHFFGPVIWLAPLMLPIELVSHIVRPISLALRLMGNMFADHKVLGTFFFLAPAIVPLPFYVLGVLVCVVQTLVFTLLTMIYIDQAIAHEAH